MQQASAQDAATATANSSSRRAQAASYPSSSQHRQDEPTQQMTDGSENSKLALNLHVSNSVDSDDNGTCFNSIGTTTPRQRSPSYAPGKYRNNNSNNEPYQPHLHEDLRFPNDASNSGKRLQPIDRRLQLSSDDCSVGGPKQLSPLMEGASPRGNGSTPGNSRKSPARSNASRGDTSIWDRPEELISTRYKSSDNASVCSEFDQEGAGESAAVVRGEERRRSRTSRQTDRVRGGIGGSVASSRYSDDDDDMHMSPGRNGAAMRGGGGHGDPVLNKVVDDEVDQFLSKPHVKAALGVGAAATLCGEFSLFVCL